MSAPSLIGCAAAALCLGLPIAAATAQLEARSRAAGIADAAALAASDAAAGWIDADPCEIASEVATRQGAEIDRCAVDAVTADARLLVTVRTPLRAEEGRAHAAPEGVGAGTAVESGPVSSNGWAWPSDVRAITQGFHDGLSIDLAVSPAGALYAPYDGVVVRAGPDGGGLPTACLAHPDWWNGPNHTVLIRHEYDGRVLYSSHNHIAPGSATEFGIEAGTRVTAGQRVATSGMSGCTSGPHSHFTLSSRLSNAYPDVNPFDYLGVP